MNRLRIAALCLLWLFALVPFRAAAQVTITQQPLSANVLTGAALSLSVQATGSGPLFYQWQLNGVNIPGANGSVFTIASFLPVNSGDYSVAVADALGAVNSEVARVRALLLTALPFTDNLSGSNMISGLAGIGRGSNVGATRESGEPDHANQRGKHSVWLAWRPPPPAGVATIDLTGSSFDTLLAVYTGDSFGKLKLVESNDDVNSCEDATEGFHTSRVSFNAQPGKEYHIAVDGLADAAGDIVLSWNFVPKDHLKPSVAVGPKVKAGSPGGRVSISASVQSDNGATQQWYFNCQPIVGATETNLQVDNLQRSKVGNYVVRVRHTRSGEETLSDPTSVQINITDGQLVEIAALDKFPEASDNVRSNPLSPSRLQRAALRSSTIRKQSGGPARGYRGTQIFSTVGATKDPGEPNHCGQSGGASEWFAYQPPANGQLVLDTGGSDFDTVLAVYSGPGTDFQSLVPVACDNNSGSDGKTSKVIYHATKDTVYYIAVDGVRGAVGTVVLNYVLNPPNTPPAISSIAGQTTNEDTPLAGLALTVNDAETAATNLVVTCSTSNPALVPHGSIAMSGNGSNRTMAITPVTNQNGTATITTTVADPEGASASSSFVLTVNPVNDPPTLSSVANPSTNEDTPTAAIPFSIGDVETTAGGLTVSGRSSNPGLVPDANIVFGGSGSNRSLTLMPAANQSGTASITITVVDPGGASASRSFVLSVNPVNDPPTLSSVANPSTNEDTPTAAIPFSIGDVETTAGSLTVTGHSFNQGLVPDANIVLGGSGSNRTLSLMPATNQSGTASITITVADPGGASASSSFVLSVNPVNDPPTLSNVANQSTNEDTPTAAIPFSIGDVETSAGSLTVSTHSSNQGLVPDANIVLGGSGPNRMLTVTSTTNQSGTATITITVADPGGASVSSSFVLSVNPVNDPPTLSSVANQSTNEDTPTPAIPFSIGDVETSAGSLTVSGRSSNQGLVPDANIVFGGSGSNRTLTVIPAANQSGTTTITITVADPGGALASRSFVLTVNPVNDPPTISSVPDQSTDEATLTDVIPFAIGDVESTAGSLTVTGHSFNQGLVADANIVFGGTGPNRTLTLMPAANQSGTATITITVADPDGASATRSFVLTVNPVNDPPTLSSVANQSTNEDTPTPAIPFVIGDAESTAGSLTVSGRSSNPGLVPDGNIVFGGSGPNRTLTLMPAANQSGTATITITIADPGGASASRSFLLTVNPVNDPPTISSVPDQSMDEDTPTAAIPFSIGDLESTAGSLTVTVHSSNQGLVRDTNIVFGGSGSNRTLTVIQAANQSGTTTITITVADPGGALASRSFVLTVNPVNDPPTISSVPDQSTDEATLTDVIPFAIGDVESTAGSLTVTGHSFNQGLVADGNIVFGGSGPNRTLTLMPAANQSGTATITITVTDPDGASASRSFVLTVNPVNDPPTISSVANQSTNEDTPTPAIPFAIGDAESTAGSLTITGHSFNQGLVPDGNIVFGGSGPNRTLTLMPAANQSGTATITITVADPGGASASRSFLLTVNPVNDPPTISSVPNQSMDEDTPTAAIPFSIGDLESTAGSLTVTVHSSNQGLVRDANIVVGGSGSNRTLTVIPAANQSGTTTITITVADPGGALASRSFVLTVNPVNDPPTISSLADQSTDKNTPTPSIPFSIGDVESTAGSLTITGHSFNQGLVPDANIVIGGSGLNRTLTLMPAANQSGTATITITVADPDGASASSSFLLTVNPVNDPPNISSLADQSTDEDTPTAAISFSIGDVESTAGSLTVTGHSSNQGLVPDASILFGGSGSNRTLTLMPAANQSGTATIIITVADPDGASASSSFLLTVNPVSDPPTISSLADRSTDEDTPTAAIPFAIGDVESSAGSLTLTGQSRNQGLVPDANIVFGGSGPNRTLTLMPAANQSGTATITVTVADPDGASASRSFVLTVNPVNDPPTISSVADQSMDEDTPTAAIPFSIGDVESTVGSLTVTGHSFNQGLVPDGSIVFGGSGQNRTLTLMPAANQSGTATITITVADPDGASASRSFVLTVDPVNDPPTISSLADLSRDEDTPTAAIPFAIGDVESTAGSLSITGHSFNQGLVPDGSIVFGGSGPNRTLTLMPAANQSGTATITITVADPGGASASSSFVLTVNPVNDPPTLSSVANQSTGEDTPTAAIPFSIGDVESTAGSLTVTGHSFNQGLVPDGNIVFGGSGPNRMLTLMPAANQSGTATITITVADPDGASASRSFVLSVNPVNDPPTISSVLDQSMDEDTPTPAIPIAIGDVESTAGSLTITGHASNQGLVPDGNMVFGGSGPNRTLTLMPAANQTGTATITITVVDPDGASASRSFVLSVNPVNDPPTISSLANQSTYEDTPAAAIPFSIGDVEGIAGSLTVTGHSFNQDLVPDANIVFDGSGPNRTLTLMPAANQSGTATITITVADPDGASASSSFVLTVNPVNDPPTISSLANQSTYEDTPTAAIPFSIGDVEGIAGSLTVTGHSFNQGLVPDANIVFGGSGLNRTLTLMPTASQSGTATIIITVADPNGASASSSFVLTVNPVNDPPTISSIADQSMDEDTPTAVIPFSIGDVESTAGSLSITGHSFNQGLVPEGNIVFGGSGPNRTLTLVSAANQSGTATITITVADPDGASASSSFVLTVNPVNDPPTISSLPDQSTDEDTPSSAIPFAIGDVETTGSSLTVSGHSSNQGLVPDASILFGGSGLNRTFTLMPAANQSGTATITITVADPDGASASRSFVLSVNPVNDPPTISSLADQSTDEDTPTAAIPFSISDVESTGGSLTIIGHSSNQGLVPDASILFGGSGPNRTLTLMPAANQSGTATITITVADPDGASASRSFVLSVNPVNDPPTISSLADQSTDEDTPTAAIPFSISDVESTGGSLTVIGHSSNQGLVPDAIILFGGGGPNRTLTLMPAANQSGAATITITVADPDGASASSSFLLTVNSVNDLPTVSHFANQVTAENTPTAAVPFTVGDVETPAESLRLDGGSSNTNLVPNENIVFSGAGPDRTVIVTPAISQSGTAVITVTVTDADGGAASETFVLAVNSAQPLQFVSGLMLNNGAFRLRLTASTLQNTVIEVSSDLSGWRPVFTNSDQTNMVEWIDTSVTNDELRFYRAVR